MNFPRVMCAVICSYLMAVGAGCGGDDFSMFPEGYGHDAADSADVHDAKPEADAPYEADATVPEASPDAKPEAAPEAQPEAGEDVVAEAEASVPDAPPDTVEEAEASAPESQPEAGEDVAVEAETSVPDAPPDAIEEPDVQVVDAPFDGSAADLCTLYGTDGKVSMVILTFDAPPAGKVIAVYGDVDFTDSDAGTDIPEGVLLYGQPGSKLAVVVPADEADLIVRFLWGFTANPNPNPTSWSLHCNTSACEAKDMVAFCAGKVLKGSLINGQTTGICSYGAYGNGTKRLECYYSP